MKVLQIIRKEFIKNQPLKGMRISACLHVTTETANLMITPEGRRRRRGAVRLQPALHAGRRGRLAGARLRHPGVRHQGRGQRHLLPAHHGRARPQAADHHGRRRRPGHHCCTPSARTRWTASSAARKRPPPASFACAPWPRTACCSSPSSPSTTPTPSTCSTTATAPARSPSTASFAPPTSCWPARTFVVAGYGWCGRGLAMPRRGMGADVIVTEVDPTQGARSAHGRLPRHADGTKPPRSATCSCTVTGDKHVLRQGALRGDEGRRHRLPTPATSTSRSTLPALEKMASSKRTTREFVEEYTLRTGARSTCWAKAA